MKKKKIMMMMMMIMMMMQGKEQKQNIHFCQSKGQRIDSQPGSLLVRQNFAEAKNKEQTVSPLVRQTERAGRQVDSHRNRI